MRKLRTLNYLFAHLLIISIAVLAKTQGNPANDLVNIINENRTAHKLPKLFNNPGLGCMALQYISECKENCSSNNKPRCQHPEVDFTEIFAPNCGVELPTFDIISGRIVGCQWNYLNPAEAFSTALILDQKTLSILHQKEHKEVGVGLCGTHKGPFFWCALFSSGLRNSSFVLEGGRGITQKMGCFSGTDGSCSAGQKLVSLEGFSAFVLSVVCFVYVTLF